MRRHVLTVALSGLLLAAGAQAATKHKHTAHSAATKSAAASTGAAPQATAPSSANQARINAIGQYQKDLVSVLALRSDAKHLLGAALLARPLRNQPQGLSYHDLITRAAKAPNAGPGVAWAQLADCDAQANPCPNADAFAWLQKHAADNAAVWMLAMDLDAGKNDPKAVRADLVKGAAARTYDDYFGVALQALTMSVGSLPPLPDTMAGAQRGDPTTAAGVELLIAFGVANDQPRPSLQPLLQLCAADNASKDAALKGDCLKLAHQLEWGSSLMGRAVGLHIRGELDPATKDATGNEARNLGWDMQNYGTLGMRSLTDEKLAQQFLQAARTGGTELSLVLSTLRANNIPTDAPAGWQPPQAAQPASGSSRTGPAAASSTGSSR